MLELTKKRPTETVELRFHIPVAKADDARQALAALGGREASTPWREVYPSFGPGEALQGARAKEGMTQKALAARLGITQANLSLMEHGKRPIGKEMAKRLSAVLDVDYRLFL